MGHRPSPNPSVPFDISHDEILEVSVVADVGVDDDTLFAVGGYPSNATRAADSVPIRVNTAGAADATSMPSPASRPPEPSRFHRVTTWRVDDIGSTRRHRPIRRHVGPSIRVAGRERRAACNARTR